MMESLVKKRVHPAVIGCVAVMISLAGYLCLVLYLTWPVQEFSMEKAAMLGNSFAAASTLYSGLAFVGIIWAIRSQREELLYTRNTQVFDSIFFCFFDRYLRSQENLDFQSICERLKRIKEKDFPKENLRSPADFFADNKLTAHFSGICHIITLIESGTLGSETEFRQHLNLLRTSLSDSEKILLNMFSENSDPQLNAALRRHHLVTSESSFHIHS